MSTPREASAALVSDLARLARDAGVRLPAGTVIAERGRPVYAFASHGPCYLAVYETHVHYKRYDAPGGVVVGQGTLTRGRHTIEWLAHRVRIGLTPNPRTPHP